MAEKVELLPAYDGDIVSEIQEGQLSRRNFLVAAGFAGMGVFGGVRALQTLTDKVPILVNSNGVLIHEPARCVDCRRCELACSEFNSPASGTFASNHLARIRIGRNAGWAPGGRSLTQGTRGPETNSGDWRMAGETCKQCPHPVPCAEACPRGAIERNDTTGARKINEDKCIGCGICTVACPWGMPSLDKERKKASKCFLCDGSPECAHACPTGAVKFVAWRDTRGLMPLVKQGMMPASTTTNCSSCHASQM